MKKNNKIINYLILNKLLLLIFFTKSIIILNSNTIKAQSINEIDFLFVNLTQLDFEAKISYDNKDYKEASRKYLKILQHKPTDIPTLYNLASCYAYLKKPELAAKVLKFTIDAGLNNVNLILTDSIWNPIKKHKLFQPILEEAKTIIKERGNDFYAESRVIIKGRIRKPDNYDSTKAYPLLIFLHGNGANPESYMYLRDGMGANNLFVAAAQGPYSRKILDNNSPSYSWFYLTRDKDLWKRGDPLSVEYILNVIDELKKQYNISNVYLLGHSQGGALAYLTGIRNPEKIRGIICFGAGNPKDYVTIEEFSNASQKLPIFIGHGWSDNAAPFEVAQETKLLLKNYGFDVTFKPFKGEHRMEIDALIEARKWIEGVEATKNISK